MSTGWKYPNCPTCKTMLTCPTCRPPKPEVIELMPSIEEIPEYGELSELLDDLLAFAREHLPSAGLDRTLGQQLVERAAELRRTVFGAY